ncbi:MAG: tetratricopeptide repeat protein [Terriglobales bacterium]
MIKALYRNFALIVVCLSLSLAASVSVRAQSKVTLGSIVGRTHVARGDSPKQQVLVTLELHGAAIDSVYTDSQGTFGFHNLVPNSYVVSVNDSYYQPAQTTVVIEADSLAPLVFVNLTLVPKDTPQSPKGPARPSGANPDLTDVREQSARFPKNAKKEFEKGVHADSLGKRDEAIQHYEKAISIAPDFYPAHNNLGADRMAKSDLPAARNEFSKVVELNQGDAVAYFNLSNVCLLMGDLPEARRYLDEGMRRQPDSALGHFLEGTLSIRLGKLSEAEEPLRQAVQLDPLMFQPRLQLVNLMLQQGRTDDAIAQLHDFVTTFPEGPYSAQAKNLLKRLQDPSASGPPVSK